MPLRQTGLTLARRLGYENADDSEKTPPGAGASRACLGMRPASGMAFSPKPISIRFWLITGDYNGGKTIYQVIAGLQRISAHYGKSVLRQ